MTGRDAHYAWMKHWNQVGTAQVLMAINEVGADTWCFPPTSGSRA